jgi:integrase
MPTLTIRTRTTSTGAKRFDVRYRLGGYAYPVEHGGTFQTKKEAKLRRDLIAGELAAGRNPTLVLTATRTPAPKTKTLVEWADQYRTSRIDLAEESTKNLGSHLKRILPTFGERDPQTIAWGEIQEWVASVAVELKPGSVKRYMTTLRQLLDFAGVDPNPSRDKRVKLPTVIDEEPQPPTASQFLALLDAIPARWVLPLVTVEQTAITVGEAEALAWGDVDVAGCQFRLRRSTVKAQIRSRARWVQVPEWLMDELALTCPLEDRNADRKVFAGFTGDGAKNAMARACKLAGITHFHPHDLRHRRITIWHHSGIPAKVLAERAGHARASMSLDVYSHVMPLEETDAKRLRDRIRSANSP